ncbi:hypothetical protein L218DRAFT_323194 [Marasmius fiardii PR-910]|nr:hypothetical protein L218DRAFT_323194 [Marasmius fiardii PR-910]
MNRFSLAAGEGTYIRHQREILRFPSNMGTETPHIKFLPGILISFSVIQQPLRAPSGVPSAAVWRRALCKTYLKHTYVHNYAAVEWGSFLLGTLFLGKSLEGTNVSFHFEYVLGVTHTHMFGAERSTGIGGFQAERDEIFVRKVPNLIRR